MSKKKRVTLKTRHFPNPMLPVLLLCAVVGIVALLFVRHLYLTELRPSTVLIVAIAFAWAFLAMIISVILVAATSGRVRSTASSRAGQVNVEMQDAAKPLRQVSRLSGPGVEMAASVDIGITSRLPSLFLYSASLGLGVFVIWFHLEGQSTFIGSGSALMLSFYISNWARNAWPVVRR